MILSCHNLTKSFHEEYLFKNCSFVVEDNEKAAIVGINGCGKSTLLKMILGKEPADDGIVTFAKDKTIGYLAQTQDDINPNETIYNELLSTKAHLIRMEQQLRDLEASLHGNLDEETLKTTMENYEQLMHRFKLLDGYTYESEITGVLNGLGFSEDDYHKQISVLSGGQKTRVALGKILLQNPDIIFLDEPTNHLDLPAIRFLENYLKNYKGAVVLVSHDRYFLDHIVTKIVEIDNKKVHVFSGNYSAYSEKKKQLRISEMNAYLNQQREIKHQEEVIEKLRSFNREKSIKRADSRQKQLDKIDRMEKPTEERSQMNLKLVPNKLSGNDVLSISDLSKVFDSNRLFDHLDMEIKRSEHVAIIGKNGTGKTTILKIINDIEQADEGKIKIGANVEIGYYDQEHHVLHEEKTIFDEISDDYPDLTNTQIRNTLAAFLFTGDDVFKKISALSGGEKGRVSLAKLMLSNANFLILDEPTNHLDIVSKEILEQAINQYEGTILYVSHDRFFINQTATRILDLEDKKLVNYIGNYDYYIEKHGDIIDGISVKKENNTKESSLDLDAQTSSTKTDWKEQKEFQANKRKLENQSKKLEERIGLLEEEIDGLNDKMAQPEIATNVGKLAELSRDCEAKTTELESLYEQWEDVNSQLEELLQV